MSENGDTGARFLQVGYARNAHDYVLNARNDMAKVSTTLTGATTRADKEVFFFANNTYKDDQLAECVKRNSEGLLLNMACHEIAIAVKYFGLTVRSELGRVGFFLSGSGKQARQTRGFEDRDCRVLSEIPKSGRSIRNFHDFNSIGKKPDR